MTDTLKKFCCEFCYSPIGHVDLSKLAVPMKPEMFKSLYPSNGVPDPFHTDLEWRDFKCPYCRLRPFLGEDWVTLIDDRGNRTRIEIKDLEKKEESRDEKILRLSDDGMTNKAIAAEVCLSDVTVGRILKRMRNE